MSTLAELVRSWDGVAVVMRHDRATDAWIFICLHDNTLGPPTGGSRINVYSSPADGLLDAMRLAEGMTHKWAAVGLPFGGGKAVLCLQRNLEKEERQGLLTRYGQLVETLRGAFRTGEDLGTTSSDMLLVSRYTRHIHGFDSEGRKIDPSPFTARGVVSGIRAALEVAFGTPDVAERRILIEGVGNVGQRLAETLSQEGASLLLADVDEERVNEVAARLGGRVVEVGSVSSTPCDVYAPCAVGATLNAQTIPTLACRVVAGSANNQLRDPADAERLLSRSIVYVPDFIINAGGAVAFAQIDRGLRSAEEIFPIIDGIGETVRSILSEAESRGETPLAAARRRVEETLTLARQGSSPTTADS
jgi:leucine dehydrogenase